MTFSDPAWTTRDDLALVPKWDGTRCYDCQQGVRIGGTSVITNDLQSRKYCQPCASVRSRHGWTYDPRSIADLRAAALTASAW